MFEWYSNIGFGLNVGYDGGVSEIQSTLFDIGIEGLNK